MTQRLSSLIEIADRYDVVLCDVWGVLHNGIDAFAKASEALSSVRERGVTVVLITNSPRPAPGVISQMRTIGVLDSAYDRIVTSGDVTRRLIAEGPKSVFLLGPERDTPILEGLGVILSPAQVADCVVCTGFFDDEIDVPEDYEALLRDFVARSVPMICANPDLVVERGERIVPCAGAVAAYFTTLGGETRIAGKPHHPIYEAALAAAREVRKGPIDQRRIIAIGDGMPTDVRGAVDAGLDLLYISGGIHAADYTTNGETDEARLKSWLTAEGVEPQFWMPRLA